MVPSCRRLYRNSHPRHNSGVFAQAAAGAVGFAIIRDADLANSATDLSDGRSIFPVLYSLVTEDYKDTKLLRAFGVVVKRHREAKGASQEHLAELAGLHRTYVSDIERGIRNLTFSSANRIANGLSVPISILIAEAERFLTEVESGTRPRINGF